MKLTMLGTGNAMATKCYNTCFLLNEGDEYFMVDAGGGNQIFTQLEKAEADWQKIRTIFVTHKHIDHLTGIIWMIRKIGQAMYSDQYEGNVTIYAHNEVIEILKYLISTLLSQKKVARYVGERIHLVEVKDGESKTILGKKVTFFDIHSTKAKQFGFTMYLTETEKLTCCGDEPYNENERVYAKNSKWLLHEAFCLFSQADIFHPYEKHHSTPKDAAALAQELGVENLVLYHTEDKNIKNRKELYTAEGKEFFQGNLYVPDDLESIEL